VWKRAKNQNESGVVRWQEEFSAGEICVLLKVAMGMLAADGDKSAMAACFCVRVHELTIEKSGCMKE
jgi:hypothetical protein